MILKKFLSPFNLVEAQIFCIHKLTKIIITDNNKNLECAIFQVVVPSFKSFSNSQKILIITLVSSLYKDYLFQKKI